MTERPLAEFHADAMDVLLTPDGAFAALGIGNGAELLIVSLPRDALEDFVARAIEQLAATHLMPSAQQV
jgi:hypothetical protein